MQLVREKAVHNGTIVITDNQFSGRGQRGNVWKSKAGENLTFSILLNKLQIAPTEQFIVTQFCSLAVYHTLKPWLGNNLRIKWPNDLYFDSKKICGMLIEFMIQGSILEWTILGVGININQTDFDEICGTSLKAVLHKEIDRSAILNSFCQNLESVISLNKEAIKQEYLGNLLGINEWRTFEDASGRFKGRIVGITKIGELLIEKEDALNKYQMKEVHYLFE